MTTLAFVRHGIFSKHEDMSELSDGIREHSPGTQVQNKSYRWRNSVLLNGIKLAVDVEGACQNDKQIQDVVLVGHSQGGLVCRVAAAALCEPQQLCDAVAKGDYVDSSFRKDGLQELDKLLGQSVAAKRLRGVITLGTPNSGAVTYGQLSTLGKLALQATNLIGALGASYNLPDLTTDRLFRVLQHVKISGVNYLSVSGSSINRFSRISHAELELVPIVKRLGLRLKLPNDLIVEDESVDISKAVLLPEIADVAKQYKHVRWYIDCAKVHHTNVHSNRQVFALIASSIAAWRQQAPVPSAQTR